ncbi:MAG: phasin family protein [Bradyrhizobium sp.]
MVRADESMVRGTGKGKAKADTPGKKPEMRTRKPRQKAEARADQLPERQTRQAQELKAQEPVDAAVAPAESSAIETAAIEPAAVDVAPAEIHPIETVAIEPVAKDVAPVAPAAPAPVEEVVLAQCAAAPVSYQAITNAYGDYTRRSIEQTSSFFEQLAGARSFNRVFQLQTEYAQQAYETFVAESQKIRDMHRELTRQRLQRFEGLVTGTTATRSK